jgi:hypothetical protein
LPIPPILALSLDLILILFLILVPFLLLPLLLRGEEVNQD